MLSPDFSPANTIRKYRLAPADLPRGKTQARVTSVAVVGLESLTLLLHLDRFAKPLAIVGEEAQSLTAQLAHTAHSPTFQDWVGQTVTIHVVKVDGASMIVVAPRLAEGEHAQPQPRATSLATLSSARFDSSVLTPILLIIVLILVLLAVPLIENSEFFTQLFAR